MRTGMEWDQWYHEICMVVAKKSQCLSRKIGAVLVRDKSIISTGYNGPPRGIPHCNERYIIDPVIRELIKSKGKDPDNPKYHNICPRNVAGFKSGEGLDYCLHGNTKIKLLKGETKTIEELSEENKDEWVYSVDTNTLEIVPSLATNFRMTGIRNDLVEVLLDDGSRFKVTYDHKILLKNGSYKEAGKLQKDDRLIPMYYSFNDGYEAIGNYGKLHSEYGNLGNTRSIATKNMVFEYFHKGFNSSYNDIIHHKDENKRNNTPENLEYKTRREHSSYHMKKNDREFFVDAGRKCIEKRKENYDKYIKESSLGGTNSMTANWNNKEFRDRMKIIQKQNGKMIADLTNSDKDTIIKRARGNVLKGVSRLIGISKEKVTEKNYSELCNHYKFGVGKGFGFPSKEIISKYFNDIGEVIKIADTNHRVISITPLLLSVPVYDVEVPLYHNFAIDLESNSTVFAHNCIAGHGERNALNNAARHGIATKGASLYMSCGFPCHNCMVEIINCGIKEIVITKEIFYDISSKYLLEESKLKYRVFDRLKGEEKNEKY